jgi:hypothetical protein
VAGLRCGRSPCGGPGRRRRGGEALAALGGLGLGVLGGGVGLRPGAQDGAGQGGGMQAQQVVLVIAHVTSSRNKRFKGNGSFRMATSPNPLGQTDPGWGQLAILGFSEGRPACDRPSGYPCLLELAEGDVVHAAARIAGIGASAAVDRVVPGASC